MDTMKFFFWQFDFFILDLLLNPITNFIFHALLTILKITSTNMKLCAMISKQWQTDALYQKSKSFQKLFKVHTWFLRWDFYLYLFLLMKTPFMINPLCSVKSNSCKIQTLGIIIDRSKDFLKQESIEVYSKLLDYLNLTRCSMMWDGMKRRSQKMLLRHLWKSS